MSQVSSPGLVFKYNIRTGLTVSSQYLHWISLKYNIRTGLTCLRYLHLDSLKYNIRTGLTVSQVSSPGLV